MKALEILKNEILIKERTVEVVGWGIHNLFEYREALQELEDLQNRSCKNCKFGMIYPFDDEIIGFKVEDKFIFSESISPCSSRVEAIFKAYEWILKEIKEKL